jgi:hypothetical protein
VSDRVDVHEGSFGTTPRLNGQVTRHLVESIRSRATIQLRPARTPTIAERSVGAVAVKALKFVIAANPEARSSRGSIVCWWRTANFPMGIHLHAPTAGGSWWA